MQASARGNNNLAIDLLNHALQLDPSFSSAWASMASEYLTLGHNEQAKHAIASALKHADRLNPLERMKLHAQWITIYNSKMAATNAWKVISDLYPDDAVSANNTGLYYAAYFNDCASALPYLRHAADLPQTFRPASIYIMATCLLSTGNTQVAIQNFKLAYQDGFRGQFLALADAYVENRQYSKASDFLTNVPNDPDTLISLAIRRALVRTDQGDLSGAESGLRHALDTLTPDLKSQEWPIRLDLVGVLWAQGENTQALTQVRKDVHTLLGMSKLARQHLGADYPTLLAMYSRWSARLGDLDLAREGIKVASEKNRQRGYPVRAQLIAAAQAEVALKQGDPIRAENIASAADSHPIWELIEVIARAKAAAHQSGAAKAYERVISNRPLAFGELFENELGICTRSAQWNISLLDAAKYMAHNSKPKSSSYASLFLDYWHMAPATNPYIHDAHQLLRRDM